MTEPNIMIRLDKPGRIYEPGEPLKCEFLVEGVHACSVKLIEASVLWHTQGKGEEDLAVHQLCRYEQLACDKSSGIGPFQFETVLPNSPLSYRGRILDIRWCMRVRAILHSGRKVSSEQAFQLGAVPRAASWASGATVLPS